MMKCFDFASYQAALAGTAAHECRGKRNPHNKNRITPFSARAG